MQYAKVNKTVVIKYPYTWADLQNENVSTMFDNRFSLEGWYAQTDDAMTSGESLVEVVESAQPIHIRGRIISEVSPELVEGVYTQAWSVDDTGVDLLGDLRDSRNQILVSTDWTQASDSTKPVTDQTLWATYRQELRDLPAKYASNPEDVVWSIAPNSSNTPVDTI